MHAGDDYAYTTWDALRAAQPAWVYSIWRSPRRRAALAVGWLILATLIFIAAFSVPPVGFTRKGVSTSLQ